MLEKKIVRIWKNILLLVAVVFTCVLVNESVMADSTGSVAKLTISIAEEKIVSNGVISDTMPEGISFDAKTNTLTMTDFSCEGSLEITGGTLNLALVGNNTISTGDETANWIGIKASDLILQGEGTLNIHSKAAKGYGILADGFKMLSGTLNIEADNETNFYGISKYPSYQEASSDYEILGGKIIISSADVSNYNVGIDAQNSNLIIQDASIEISIGKGYGYGVVTGLKESSTKYYGGIMMIDQADIQCFVQKGWSMYFFELQNLSDSEFYVGAETEKKETAYNEIFIPNPYYCNRYECEVQYLTINTPDPKPDPGSELPFIDVFENDWFYSDVKYVYDRGIMTGLTTELFGPYDCLSRAQFATILYRIEGSPEVEYTTKFGDVPDGYWFTDPIMWANETGVATGYSQEYFGAIDAITREQMAVMIYRYARYKGDDMEDFAPLDRFTDAYSVSSFAKEGLSWCVANGIINGKENGTLLQPMNITARAECAAIIQRILEK